MSLAAESRNSIEAALGRKIRHASRLHGGCIAEVWRVALDDGGACVAKLGKGLSHEGFMLDWLRRNTAAPVPGIRVARDDLLIMDYITHDDGALDAEAEVDLARIVAGLHEIRGDAFGFARDTLIGGLAQPNPPTPDWRGFFAEHRLRFMAHEAHAAGRLPARLLAGIDRLAGDIGRWIDAGATPRLIHGDLWHGNILARGGRIVGLLDPALYFADPEIELAFMTLFGSVGERFFAAYREIRPIVPGFFEIRRDLYNLYPLLVHVRLFGAGYVAQVERTLERFAA